MEVKNQTNTSKNTNKKQRTLLNNDLSNSESFKSPQDFVFTNHINYLNKVTIYLVSFKFNSDLAVHLK